METIRFKTAVDGEGSVIARAIVGLLPPTEYNLPYNDKDFVALLMINGQVIIAHCPLVEMEEKLNLIGLGLEDT